MPCLVVRVLWHGKKWRNIEPFYFPVIYCFNCIDEFNMANCLLNTAESHRCQILANFFSNEFKEVGNEFWLATKACTQFRVLCCNTYWACIEMTYTHHDATTHHKRRCCKAKLFSTKQCSNYYVAASFHLSVCLHNNAVAQTIEHQGLLCFSKTKFPRGTCMLE